MDLISIIIPTYKPDAYLEHCIASIASQTYDNFELIIILNGCYEPYYSNIKSYIKKYNLVSKCYIIQTEQGGVSNARNMGIDISKGKYITFIDDDDYISNEYLQGLIEVITEDCVSISNARRIDLKGNVSNCSLSHSYDYLSKKGFKSTYRSRGVLNSPWMKLYPRNIIGSSRFDTSIALGEDALFNFEVSCKIKKLIATNSSAIYFHNARIGSSWDKKKDIFLIMQLMQLFIKYCKIYFSNPLKFNFIFFINRLIAIFYTFLSQILKNKCKNL